MNKVLRQKHRIQTIVRNFIPLFLFFCITTNINAQVKPDTIIVTQEKTIFDTVFIQDTILISDTIFENGKFFKSIAFYAGVSFPSGHWGNLTYNLKKINNESSSNRFSYSTGIDFKLDSKKWSYSSGISYTDLSQKFSLKETQTLIDSSLYYVYDSTNLWQIDTIDTYYQQIGNDTITIYVTDSTEIWNIDSTLNYTMNITTFDTTYTSINNFRCLQIPIIVHKPLWLTDNHVFYFQAGLLGNIILQEKILYMGPNGLKEIHNQTIQFRPQALIGISWEQYIGDFCSLELHSNYWFNPLLEKPSFSSWDIRFGIRYYL